MLESRVERSALGAVPDIAVVVDVGLTFLFPKRYLNCWITRANKQMTPVASPHLISHMKPVSFCTNETCFCEPTKIWSSEWDSHNNHNQPKKCKLFVFFQVQGDSVFIFIFFQLVDNPKGIFWTTYKRCVWHGTYRGIPPMYTTGINGTGRVDKFGTTSIPVTDTSVSSVHQYRYQTLR